MLEPFGPVADFWQAGLIASMLANVNRTKKSDKTYTPDDFMPKSMTAQPDADPETVSRTIRDRFQALADLHRIQGQ